MDPVLAQAIGTFLGTLTVILLYQFGPPRDSDRPTRRKRRRKLEEIEEEE